MKRLWSILRLPGAAVVAVLLGLAVVLALAAGYPAERLVGGGEEE